MYEKELQQLGLSDKEARVYLAALELGSATVQELSRKAGVRRPTAYVAVEALIKHGLLSSHERAKKHYFAPTLPDRLLSLLEQEEQGFHVKKEALRALLPALRGLFAGSERPVVQFFEGKAGILALYDDFLLASKGDFVEVADIDGFNQTFSDEERAVYRKKLTQKKIHMRGIVTSMKGPPRHVPPYSEVRFVEKKLFPLAGDIAAYGDKLALTVWNPKPIGVLIESKQAAQTFRVVFEFMWDALKRKNRSD